MVRFRLNSSLEAELGQDRKPAQRATESDTGHRKKLETRKPGKDLEPYRVFSYAKRATGLEPATLSLGS